MIAVKKWFCIAIAAGLHGAYQASEGLTPEMRQKLLAKSQAVAKSLKWARVQDARITQSKLSGGVRLYGVTWQGGTIYFTESLQPRICTIGQNRSRWDSPARLPLPNLTTQAKSRVQAVAKQVCRDLGLGPVASFKEIKAARSRDGGVIPVFRVSCRMQVDSKIPIYSLSEPITDIEIGADGYVVSSLTAALPTTVKPLTKPEDLGAAKQAIASYIRKTFGKSLNVADVKVTLELVDWPEGDYQKPEVKRLYAERRVLIPIYVFRTTSLPVEEIWFDANKMTYLASREKPSM